MFLMRFFMLKKKKKRGSLQPVVCFVVTGVIAKCKSNMRIYSKWINFNNVLYKLLPEG